MFNREKFKEATKQENLFFCFKEFDCKLYDCEHYQVCDMIKETGGYFY